MIILSVCKVNALMWDAKAVNPLPLLPIHQTTTVAFFNSTQCIKDYIKISSSFLKCGIRTAALKRDRAFPVRKFRDPPLIIVFGIPLIPFFVWMGHFLCAIMPLGITFSGANTSMRALLSKWQHLVILYGLTLLY